MTENSSYIDQGVEKILESLQQFIDFSKEQMHAERSLENYHPIAVVGQSKIRVFDIGECGNYTFMTETKRPDFVPDGVLAAMPIEFYENKVSAVVDEDALQTVDGKVAILHEFVHCHQFSNGELALKSKLKIAQKAMEEQNWMWEIEHPFPYDQSEVSTKLKELANWQTNRIQQSHLVGELRALKSKMTHEDFEYMVWQIWKEGYARYIENLIRTDVGLAEIYREYTGKINRSIFYQIGDMYFRNLSELGRVDLHQVLDQLLHGTDNANHSYGVE